MAQRNGASGPTLQAMTAVAPGSPPTAPSLGPQPLGFPAGVANQQAPLPATATKGGRSTPTRMRFWQGLLAALLLVWGLVISLQAGTRSGAIGSAGDSAKLVSAAQQIRAELGRADAAAINGFLAGGVEQPEQRSGYLEAIDIAAGTLQEASRFADSPEARTAVGELQRLLPRYTGLIETARANNRQNLPVGAAYLRTASDLVRGDISTQTQALRDAGNGSFRSKSDALVGGIGLLPLVATVVALAALAFVTSWLAKRTNRTLNPGLTAALALVLGGSLLISNMTRSSANSAKSAFVSGYDNLSALADLRADAYDQKAQTTFALVDRGAQQDINARADTEKQNVDTRIDALGEMQLQEVWEPYVEAVGQVRNAGSYDEARSLVTASALADTGLNAAFAPFDARVSDLVASSQTVLDEELDAARSPVNLVRLLGLALGIAAAAASAWGIQRRINEYS